MYGPLRKCLIKSTAKSALGTVRRAMKSIEQYAGNMVDWFSQRWTVGDQKWLWLFKKFERSEKKIDGCWAYKPSTPSAVVVFPDDVEGEVRGLPEGAVFERLVNG